MKKLAKYIDNKDGIILASIAIIFAVVAILTTSVLAVVYSDNKFSFDDEKRTQAYYAARSAVDTAEQGIKAQLKELKEREDILKSAQIAYEETKSDDNYNTYMTARTNYSNQHTYVTGTVLGTKNHTVKINNLSTDSTTNEYTVKVEPYMGGFRLESTASVDGISSTSAKYIGTNLTTGSKLNITAHSLLENSLYAVEGITVGNNGDVYSEVYGSGDVSFYSGNPPIFTMHNGAEIVRRTDQQTLPSPETLLTKAPTYLPVATVKTGSSFVAGTISTSASYSGTATWGDKSNPYIIDTSGGDVILQFDDVILNDDFTYLVKGDNALIIYVTGTFTKTKPTAQLKMIFQPQTIGTDKGEIYFMIEESGDSNIFDVKNNIWATNFFLYAPYTDLSFLNNFGGQGPGGLFEGLVVGKNIALKNNADIKYVPPKKFNIGIGDETIGTDATAQQLYNITNFDVGYWLKD